LALLLGFIVAGILVDGPVEVWRGVVELQRHPARLVNDFTLAGGTGAALVNASVVALMGLGLVALLGVRLSGPTVAAVFTMFGFGLFGKTPLNILPIIGGVYVAARIAGREFREYTLIALFGTAVAPLVTLVAVELALPPVAGVTVAAVAGVAAGVVLPAVAMVMLRLHQGYNLYNMGLTAGFVALFAAAIVFGDGSSPAAASLWNTDPGLLLTLLVPAVAVVLILVGVIAGRVGALKSFLRILRLSGRLPSDFMEMASTSGTLVNMGVTGLALWTYTIAVGAELNGPVLGGLFTVMGFAAFGKHPRTALPVLAGIVVAALLFGRELSAPGVILAALFGTTLAPLTGEFGIPTGVVAGFLHLTIVLRSAEWHAGIDLYNNGFAGGLTATLLVALIEWYRASRATSWGGPFGASKQRRRGQKDTQ
jgi:hypothetical protein